MKYFIVSVISFLSFDLLARDHEPTCHDEFNYAYHIYQEAMRNAKEGNCQKSLSQFKESEKQWHYLSSFNACSEKQKEDAESNSNRIAYDIGILKKRYCPNVKS